MYEQLRFDFSAICERSTWKQSHYCLEIVSVVHLNCTRPPPHSARGLSASHSFHLDPLLIRITFQTCLWCVPHCVPNHMAPHKRSFVLCKYWPAFDCSLWIPVGRDEQKNQSVLYSFILTLVWRGLAVWKT